MCDTSIQKNHATWASRLDFAERFYDGPVPMPIRRAIFSDLSESRDRASDTWKRSALESATRLRLLKTNGTPRLYRRELDWCRHCVECWRKTRRVATPAGLEPATTSLEG